VIRGAAIFAVAFTLGYAKAMSDQEAVREAAREFKNFLYDLSVAEDVKRREAADAANGAPKKEPEAEENIAEAEVVEPSNDQQGETP
jgi:uncharacterized membrane protein